MAVYREFAPAKINLTLEVLGKRPDGYHELESLVGFADIGDVVTLDTARPAGTTVTGPFGATIAGANLIDVTLAKLAAAGPELQLGHVTLDKQLPVAAGIGGGSADAAAVIRAVRRANPDRANAVDWKCVAASIGADVPVCLVPNLSWMRGVGEIVAPLGLDESVWVDALIVNPLEPVPEDKTAQVFRAYAASPNPYSWRDEDHPTIKRREDLLHAIRHGWNDLQIPAFKTMPNAQQILHEMGKVMQPGGLTGRMSGAGPTMFAIFDGAANATAAADALRRLQPRWWVQAVRLT